DRRPGRPAARQGEGALRGIRLAAERAPPGVEPVEQRRDAVAAGRGLRFGGGGVVAQAQKLDAPRAAVEDRALGEPQAVLALRVDRAHVDEVQALARKRALERLLDGAAGLVHLVHPLEVA